MAWMKLPVYSVWDWQMPRMRARIEISMMVVQEIGRSALGGKDLKFRKNATVLVLRLGPRRVRIVRQSMIFNPNAPTYKAASPIREGDVIEIWYHRLGFRPYRLPGGVWIGNQPGPFFLWPESWPHLGKWDMLRQRANHNYHRVVSQIGV